MASKNNRDAVLDRAKQLKEAGDIYKRVCIKRDTHPAVREEWKWLREAEKKEKKKGLKMSVVVFI